MDDQTRFIILYSWPVLLFLAAFPLLLLTGRPLLRKGSLPDSQNRFRSLRVASPLLNMLIAISVVGKPFLEHLKKNNWEFNIVNSSLLVAVTVFFIACLYVTIGVTIFFFFRAIQNINFFNGRKVRSPFSAVLMLVPIANLIVIPYLEYFAYHRSKGFVPRQKVAIWRAAFLVFSAFALLVLSIACGLTSEDTLTEAGIYNPLSLLMIGTCTAVASGILLTHIVRGTFQAQESYARQIGVLPSVDAQHETQGKLEMAKSLAVALLVTIALLTALLPSLVTHAVQSLRALVCLS